MVREVLSDPQFWAMMGGLVALLIGYVAGNAIVGGWRSVAARHPAQRWLAEWSSAAATVILGRPPVRIRTYGLVEISAEGIGIAPFHPINFFHPAASIPWSAVGECREEKVDFTRSGTALHLREGGIRLLFSDARDAVAVRQAWLRSRASGSLDERKVDLVVIAETSDRRLFASWHTRLTAAKIPYFADSALEWTLWSEARTMKIRVPQAASQSAKTLLGRL